jgi:hypothetical protein
LGVAKYGGDAVSPRFVATSHSVMGFRGVESAELVSGTRRSSRPSPVRSNSIGLARSDVGAARRVAIRLKPGASLLYWKRVGGVHTASPPHSSTLVRSVRCVVGLSS